jgi:hypothetical protein
MSYAIEDFEGRTRRRQVVANLAEQLGPDRAIGRAVQVERRYRRHCTIATVSPSAAGSAGHRCPN